VAELGQYGVRTSPSEGSHVSGREIGEFGIATAPVRERAAHEPAEFGYPARSLESLAVEEVRTVRITVNDRHRTRKPLGMRTRKPLARIVAVEMDLAESETDRVYGTTTFPGFMIPFGSSNFLIPR